MAKMLTNGTIKTASGIFFAPLDPDHNLIKLGDIAHALSRQCRFGGHLPCEFYSVAEHAMLVFDEVFRRTTDWNARFWALHHDDTEAYFIDFPKPIKERMPQANEIEARLHNTIAFHFGMAPDMPPIVKVVDKELCEAEKIILRGDPGKLKKFRPQFNCWNPNEARKRFLISHEMLMTMKGANVRS